MLRYEQEEQAEFDAFAQAVEEYADFQWQHMSKEESIVMPLAEKSLSEQDWDIIAKAFEENDNPLFGIKPRNGTDHSSLHFEVTI